MVERSRRSAGATLAACRAALDGCAANLAGGTHHAMPIAVRDSASSTMLQWRRGRCRPRAVSERVVVIDCDVHQGNGTASIPRRRQHLHVLDPRRPKFPLRQGESDLDIELPDGTGDEDYLSALGRPRTEPPRQPAAARHLSRRCRSVRRRPAPVLSMPGLVARDHGVQRLPGTRHPDRHRDGGRLRRPIEDTVTIHAATILAAQAYI